eukprot:8180252-Lingulodinium_polyedra.AAC.1
MQRNAARGHSRPSSEAALGGRSRPVSKRALQARVTRRPREEGCERRRAEQPQRAAGEGSTAP